MSDNDLLAIGKHSWKSRLITGTGKFENLDVMREALAASGSEIVTVAVRRVEIGQRHAEQNRDEGKSSEVTIHGCKLHLAYNLQADSFPLY